MSDEVWTIQAALDWCRGYLQRKGDENPRLSAEWLLCEACHMRRVELYVNFERPLSPDERATLRDWVARRGAGEPLQYITGEVAFRHIAVKVREGVLIPRPETEWIVDTAVNLVTSSAPRILDIGTGSGCIATSMSLALADKHCHTEAWDISEDALRIATDNAERLGADVKFRRRDALRLEENFPAEENQGGAEELNDTNAAAESWNIIVSNPPYICNREAADMHANVLRHEPHLANRPLADFGLFRLVSFLATTSSQ